MHIPLFALLALFAHFLNLSEAPPVRLIEDEGLGRTISMGGRSVMTYSRGTSAEDRFISVFDGGSTGTRLNIYQFDAEGLVLKSHYMAASTPGIASNPGMAGRLVRSMLEDAAGYLREKRGSASYDFPVVFNGTAGLRLLPEGERLGVLREVRRGMGGVASGRVEVRVIDGQEEGFYAWAALAFTARSRGHIGIIDLGGGSAQVSFDLKRGESPGHQDIIRGQKRSVFSRSFLGMGLVAGLDRVRLQDRDNACSWGSYPGAPGRCAQLFRNAVAEMFAAQGSHSPKEVAPGINSVSRMYVTSFIAEILEEGRLPASTTLREMQQAYARKCPTLRSMHCKKFLYVLLFMEGLGLDPGIPIMDTNQFRNADVSWSLGRALSILA